MYYLVDARYINHQPQLRVLSAETGQVILQWRLEQVTDMFHNGEIAEEDFLQPKKYGLQLLVKNLFLLACAEAMGKPNNRCNPGLSYRLFKDCEI